MMVRIHSSFGTLIKILLTSSFLLLLLVASVIHPLLVFPQDYEYMRIDGSTAPESRQTNCDRFQHDEQCKVAVLSITTANAGMLFSNAFTSE